MPWLTPAVFRQAPNETIYEVPVFPEVAVFPQFAHILNTYTDLTNPINNEVQKVTLASIQAARAFVNFDVHCISVPSLDDESLLPAGFSLAPSLTRSVLDVGSFHVPRNLPLLFDILDLGVGRVRELTKHQENCFIIFTNSDIHPMPHFYAMLARMIQSGYETIIS